MLAFRLDSIPVGDNFFCLSDGSLHEKRGVVGRRSIDKAGLVRPFYKLFLGISRDNILIIRERFMHGSDI